MIEQYLEVLLKELEDLDTIFQARLYGDQFEFEDISKIKIPLSSNKDFCTVYVQYAGGPLEQNPAHPDKNFVDATFNIFILGYADRTKDSVGFSSACIKCSREINRLVNHKEFHRISGATVGYSKPVIATPIANGLKHGAAKLCLHVYSYKQKMNFDYE